MTYLRRLISAFALLASTIVFAFQPVDINTILDEEFCFIYCI